MTSFLSGTLACLIALTPLAVTSPAAPAAPAQTPGAEALAAPGGIQADGLGEMVFHPSTGRTFASAHRAGTYELLVVARDSTLIARLPVPGEQVAMTSDGATVLVAVAAERQIVAVDAVSLETTRFDTGPDSCPSEVAESSGVYWFTNAGYCPDDPWATNEMPAVAGIDPADGSVTEVSGLSFAPGRLAAGAGLPDTLIAFSHHGLLSLATAAGPGGPTAVERAVAEVDRIYDVAVHRTGEVFLGTHRGIQVLDGTDLVTHRIGPTPRYDGVGDIGVSPEEWVAVRSGSSGPLLLAPGASQLQTIPGLDFDVEAMAFDGERLALMGIAPHDIGYSVIFRRPRHVPVLEARVLGKRYQEVSHGDKVKVGIDLDTPAGRTVSLVSSSKGRADEVLRTGVVPPRGVTWTVSAQEHALLTVVYAGDATTYPASVVAGGVTVAAEVVMKPRKVVRTRKGHHVVRVRTGIRMVLSTLPRLGDAEMSVSLSLKDGDRWRRAGFIKEFPLGPRGRRQLIVSTDRSLIGRQVRVRVQGPNDSKLVDESSTGWVYFDLIG